MTTDRELLELAAKAAGLRIIGGFDCGDRPGCDVLDHSRTSGTRWWSPLTDEGDALRLAVALEIDLKFWDGNVEAGRQGWFGMEPLADVRRAIVRAAAEIGRAMP